MTALGLAGCGFTPLYATPGMTPALAAVEVVTPQDREGYLLRTQLDNELARDTGTPPLYRLAITTTELRSPQGVRVNNVASRYETVLTAAYVLSDAVTGQVLLNDRASVEVSYASATPPFAGTAASQDSEVRAAEQAAIQIRLGLARYFERQAHPLAATPDETASATTVQGAAATPVTPAGAPPQMVENPTLAPGGPATVP